MCDVSDARRVSILAHGVSAVPGISLYAGRVASLGPGAPEQQSLDASAAGTGC
jgi:hypothetical protein